jgi:hypothetical protein
MKGGSRSGQDTIIPNGSLNLNTSTDSIGNISNQSGSSTSTASGSSNTAADQNNLMYNNLLHSQYLYDAIYQDENAYQNLSYLDGGLAG